MGYLTDYIKYRVYKQNKNFLCCIVGATGSGKSYTSISLAEQLNEKFSDEYIIFNPKDFMKLIVDEEKTPMGTVIIYDELGVSMSARNWQSITNKIINYVLQTFRHRKLIVFFTVPDSQFVDKQTRKLFHAMFEMRSINIDKGYSVIKPKFIQTNPATGKVYHKYLRVINEKGMIPLSRVKIEMPNKELSVKYEKKRSQFTAKLNRDILEEIDVYQKTTKPKKARCKVCNHLWRLRNGNKPRQCPKCYTTAWERGYKDKENEAISLQDELLQEVSS